MPGWGLSLFARLLVRMNWPTLNRKKLGTINAIGAINAINTSSGGKQIRVIFWGQVWWNLLKYSLCSSSGQVDLEFVPSCLQALWLIKNAAIKVYTIMQHQFRWNLYIFFKWIQTFSPSLKWAAHLTQTMILYGVLGSSSPAAASISRSGPGQGAASISTEGSVQVLPAWLTLKELLCSVQWEPRLHCSHCNHWHDLGFICNKWRTRNQDYKNSPLEQLEYP